MVQLLFEFVPEITVEWFVANRGYWRTGIYIRTIERGRRFGWVEIAPTGGLPKPKIKVKPDHVRPMKIIKSSRVNG